MLTLCEISFDAAEFAQIPARHRVFIMLLSHAANEVNILQKMMMAAHNLDDEHDTTETKGRTAQTMCLIRIIAIKLCEAHRATREGLGKTDLKKSNS